MRAVVQDWYGGPEALESRRVERPAMGEDEVLVGVVAAGVDRGVVHLMEGLPYLVRVMGFGLRAPKVRIRGREFAGTVEAVGSRVSGFQPGDPIYGAADGTFAEYAVASPRNIAPKPANLTFEEAAAVPISALTALQAIRDKGRLQPGQRVLIIGASGGVGSFAVQIAKALGAEVTAVCSTAKVDLVRSLGADQVVDYTEEEVPGRGPSYHLIVDIGGNRSLSRLRRALRPRGTLVIVGGEGGGKWLGGTERLLRAALLSPLVSQRLVGLIASEERADLVTLSELIESGAVRPVVDRVFSLADAMGAVRHLMDGQARGKVVISI